LQGAPHPAHLWRGAGGESCADALDWVLAIGAVPPLVLGPENAWRRSGLLLSFTPQIIRHCCDVVKLYMCLLLDVFVILSDNKDVIETSHRRRTDAYNSEYANRRHEAKEAA
jgi:hypothetical protein